jgi:hypothetical protein
MSRKAVATALLLLAVLGPVTARVQQISNKCTSDRVYARFEEGGWRTYYGTRMWDGKSVVTAAAAFASLLGGPATSAAAVKFMMSVLDEQLAGAADALRQAAVGLQRDASSLLLDLAVQLLEGRTGSLELPTLDLKAAMLRVDCENCANVPCPTWSNPFRTCPRCMWAEGFFRLGVAYRLRSGSAAQPAALPPAAEAPRVTCRGQVCAPGQGCSHSCSACGRTGGIFSGCRQCCN